MKKSNNCKRGKVYEKKIADFLGIQRRVRLSFWESVDDLYDKRNPHLKFDTKRRKRIELHTLFKNCEQKYCSDNDKMILITAETGKHTSLVTIDLDFFKELLNLYSK